MLYSYQFTLMQKVEMSLLGIMMLTVLEPDMDGSHLGVMFLMVWGQLSEHSADKPFAAWVYHQCVAGGECVGHSGLEGHGQGD